MENCDSTSISNKKGPYDPGWNDPPKLPYNSQQTTPNRPRNFLNKRVAFPLSGGGTASRTLPNNMPPMTVLPSPVQNLITETNIRSNTEINSDSILKEVKYILLFLLESSAELGNKADSIKKRIRAMEDMWLNGKLDKTIQLDMRDLAYALKDDNPSKADDIHKALMVDHVSAVGAWMPGVKQLIYHCAARSELLAIDVD